MYCPGLGFREAADDVERGGFPGAVGSDEAHNFVGENGKRDVVECDQSRKLNGDVFERDACEGDIVSGEHDALKLLVVT